MKFHKDGTLPQNGETFVFGSNQAGRHGAGAAKVAHEKFDAVYGSGWGWQGENRKSFAFPTKDRGLNTLSLAAIKEAANQMLGITRRYPEVEFFFTSLGCGLAGYQPSDIAPMFRDFGDNCSFPDTWKQFLILDLEEANKIAMAGDSYLEKAYVKLYKEVELWRKLKDPDILHINMLRGIPAKLNKEQLKHLIGYEND